MNRKWIIIVMCVGMLILFGCAIHSKDDGLPSGDTESDQLKDDGIEYTSDEKIVRKAIAQDKKIRRYGVDVIYGDSDKLITVYVTDETGKPLANATMDVRLYFGKSLLGSWANLPASDKGEISFFTPGYRRAMRIEIWLIKADGFMPRMLKIQNAHSSDKHMQVSEEEWNEMMSKFTNGLEDKRWITLPGYRKYDPTTKIAKRNRTIILRKK